MGYYANPTEMASSRKLNEGTYEELKAQLQDGELLGGLYKRPMFMNAVLLYSKREFDEFESQLPLGLKRIGFFAVPASMFPDYVP